MEWVKAHESSYEEMVLPFHNAFLLHIQELPIRKREMLELMYHYIVFEKPSYGYNLGEMYRDVKYPHTADLMRSIINSQLSPVLYSLHRDTQIPDWVRPNNVNDVENLSGKGHGSVR